MLDPNQSVDTTQTTETTETPQDNATATEEQKAADSGKQAEDAKGPSQEPVVQEDDTHKYDEELKKDIWGDYGDETANSVLLELQNSDITPEEAKALIHDPLLKHGDPTKIDRDALVEKIGKNRTNLVLAGIENYISRQNTRTNGILQQVYTTCGGEENWKKIRSWIPDNLTAEQRKSYGDLMDEGGPKATFAAGEILKAYNKDNKNTPLSSSVRTIEGDTSTGSQDGLSSQDYYREVKKLHEKHQNPPQQQLNRLWERRQTFMNQNR